MLYAQPRAWVKCVKLFVVDLDNREPRRECGLVFELLYLEVNTEIQIQVSESVARRGRSQLCRRIAETKHAYRPTLLELYLQVSFYVRRGQLITALSRPNDTTIIIVRALLMELNSQHI